MQKLLILGLGHLARFVLAELETSPFKITGTFRDSKKVQDIDSIQKLSFEIGNSYEFLYQNWDCILWNLPPSIEYKNFILEVNRKTSKNVPWIFISSTSVYGEGEHDESSQTLGEGRNAIILRDIEESLWASDRKCCIIRPGGLFDDIRHPLKVLEKSNGVIKGIGVINYVHTIDAARFIVHVLNHQLFDRRYNLVANHCDKREFYSALAKKFHKPEPHFTNTQGFKKISSKGVFQSGFRFNYPNLLDYFMT